MATTTKKKDVLVRSTNAGVFAGLLEKHDAKTGLVTLKKCRRIWYWTGAASLSQLAIDGTKTPDSCKFPEATAEHTIANVIEIIPITKKARASIDAVPVWRA